MRKCLNLLALTILYCAPVFSQKSDERLLKEAYATQSTVKLYQFCEHWQKELPPISAEEFSKLNDTVKEAYNLFTEFFQPRFTGKNTMGSRFPFHEDTFFFVVQNNISIYMSDHGLHYSQHEIDSFIFNRYSIDLPDSVRKRFYSSDHEMDSFIVSRGSGIKKGVPPEKQMQMYRDNNSIYGEKGIREGRLCDSITDFRPRLDNNSKWLYWSRKRYDILSQWLKDSNKNETTNSGKAPANLSFIRNTITWLPAYSRGNPKNGFQAMLYNFPQTFNYVTSIMFDKHLEYAVVSFLTSGASDSEVWHKESGRWKFCGMTSISTWQY